MSMGIYKIINPKGKIYIGQSINIEKRFRGYFKMYCFNQPRLFNSLKKYGCNNHTFEIIEECLLKCLNERERYWQDFYNVTNKEGLNCSLTTTDSKSGTQSKITRLKIGNPQIGKIVSDETKSKMKVAASKREKKMPKLKMEKKIVLDPNKRLVTTETRSKMSKSAEGKIKTQEHKNNISLNHPTKKPIMQLDLSGFFIREYISINEASRQTGYRVSDISACCNNKQKSAFGFIWIFK